MDIRGDTIGASGLTDCPRERRSWALPPAIAADEGFQESRMREICTSGSTRGQSAAAVADRPTLLALFCLSITRPFIHHVQQRLPLSEPHELIDEKLHCLWEPIRRMIRAMRRQQNILQLIQRAVIR